jgi:hypothetical protein
MYLFIAIAFVACTENPKGFESKIFTEKEVSDFIRVNPNWTKNENMEAETTEKFKHKMINLSNEPKFLEDFPLQLTAILDSTVSDQAVKVAVFKGFKDAARPKESLLNNLELEIRGIMSIDQVTNLVLQKKYTLKGMVYKQGKRGDVKFTHTGEEPIYSLGKYTFWNIAVKGM